MCGAEVRLGEVEVHAARVEREPPEPVRLRREQVRDARYAPPPPMLPKPRPCPLLSRVAAP
jgi:hypothetical protein